MNDDGPTFVPFVPIPETPVQRPVESENVVLTDDNAIPKQAPKTAGLWALPAITGGLLLWWLFHKR